MIRSIRALLCTCVLIGSATAQVYSPSVLLEGQPDPTDLRKFAAAIFRNAGATTPEARAEAIWRFFLTDGRFVEPGFWYHIAGWTYEEPTGEVLDPIRLLNSYGFGLCYHIAPLLEAVFEAGGFEDARVWFLTGHTVAEVYYDGAWHYFDSDMMGYTRADGRVISVKDLEKNPRIVLDKMAGRRDVRVGAVDQPWYPADVRAGAMKDLVSLFTSAKDNYLFPFTRYSRSHEMTWALRPGEKVIRYAQPERPDLFYLPYAFDGKAWSEFPRDVPEYGIRTADGPRSQKDRRVWGTGRIEYHPPPPGAAREFVIDMPSPWVIIDAQFTIDARLTSQSSIVVETATGEGTWETAGELRGPHRGTWTVEPRVIVRSRNGRLTAVSGRYGYKVRITRQDPEHAAIDSLRLVTRFQHNPRTLPLLQEGENEIVYRSSEPVVRAVVRSCAGNFQQLRESGQLLLRPPDGGGEAVCEVSAAGRALAGFDAGARFLDLQGGLAPDKLTAETRRTAFSTRPGTASLAWSLSRTGPWKTLWTHRSGTQGVEQSLVWPEAFGQIRDLPPNTTRAFVRLRSTGPAVDNLRLAAIANADAPAGKLKVTHRWTEQGQSRQHDEAVDAGVREYRYRVTAGNGVEAESVSFELLR